MSKKKAFSGSTMTLKDFHGGSIPSDLPLPSAPGVTARPLDRGGYERPIGGAWGSAGIARPEHHRPRPGSSGGGAVRGLEEGAPFLPHIGRNFDEDERKPFDASSVPRRAAPSVDDAIRSTRLVEARPQTHQQVLAPGRPGSSPATQLSGQAHHSYGGPVSAVVGGGSHLPSSQSQGPGIGSVAPSAWGMKKDAVSEMPVQPTATLSGPGVASRFAQASAIEKVSSGRWQSKHVSFNQLPDVEVIRFSETAGGDMKFKDNNDVDADGRSERRYGERADIERDYDRATLPVYLEAKERGTVAGFGSDRARPLSAEGRFTGHQLHQQDISEVSERLKLNVLPRAKPLGLSDTRVLDHKEVYQPPNAGAGHGENATEVHGISNPSKPGFTGTDVGNPPVERPKLNLLPRSQHLGQSSESVDRKREKVFGGARPREIVLKERGIDDDVLNDVDQAPPANRVMHEVSKTDVKLDHPAPTSRHGERAENYSLEHRVGKDVMKDQRVEPEKIDMQRSSWRNDNRKNFRDMDKPAERRQEPESWRKPDEQPKPNSEGLRFGKAASALELAQAFSRSVSDTGPRIGTSQRSLPAHNQAPFSRLTETKEIYSGPSRRHINGY